MDQHSDNLIEGIDESLLPSTEGERHPLGDMIEAGLIHPALEQIKVLKAPTSMVPLNDALIPYHLGMVSSAKKNGNRGLCIGDVLLTSSIKQPRNVHLRTLLAPLMELSKSKRIAFDYELYDPEGSHLGEISGLLNSISDPLPSTLHCYVFDAMPWDDLATQCQDLPYSARISLYTHEINELAKTHPQFIALPQRPVTCAEEAEALFEADVANGDEGSMLRVTGIFDSGKSSPMGGWYKFGRATHRQRIMFKVKCYLTLDGIITGVTQRRKMKEHLARTRGLDGHLIRPLEKDAYEPDNCVGSFSVRYLDPGTGLPQEANVSFSKGFDIALRRRWWQMHQLNPNEHIGKWIEFKLLPSGSKPGGRAQHGQLIRFRPDKDSSQPLD